MRLLPRVGRLFEWGLLLALLSGCAEARLVDYNPARKYAPEVLRKDFTLMRRILEADHPSLYWYTPKDSMDRYFDEAYARIDGPMTEQAFRNLIAATLAHIHCGHTIVRPSRAGDYYDLRHPQPEFPFQCKVLPVDPHPELALVFNPYLRDSSFQPGDILGSINGVATPTVIDSLRDYQSVDGYSYNFAYQRISGDFPQAYRNIFGTDSVFNVRIERPGAAPFNKRVRAYDLATDTTLDKTLKIFEMGAPYHPTREQELRRLRYLQVDSSGLVAVMSVRSFADGVTKAFFRKSFRILAREHVPNLVIDLRTNTGGVINTAICLARYLKPADFTFTDSVYSLTRHLEYRRYLDKGLLYQFGMTFLTHKEADGHYHFHYFDGTVYHPVRTDHYSGHVYILTGGFTFSAASIFAANMKGTPGVTLLGEETGGGCYGNDGVFITEATLPGTHLRVSLPLFRMVINRNFPKDGHGVKPDIEVVPTTADIRQGVDPKMRKVLELIGLPPAPPALSSVEKPLRR